MKLTKLKGIETQDTKLKNFFFFETHETHETHGEFFETHETHNDDF